MRDSLSIDSRGPPPGGGGPLVTAPSQFVTFSVGDSACGIDIMAVREIRSWAPTTKLQGQVPAGRGVLDIRGSIVEVFDLSMLLGGAATEARPGQVVLVVALMRGKFSQPVAIAIENDDSAMAEPAPSLGERSAAEPLASTPETIVGLLVDSVSDIIFARQEDLRPPPSTDQGDSGDGTISAFLAQGDQLVAIHNLKRLFPDTARG